jgi:hypothetical protein
MDGFCEQVVKTNRKMKDNILAGVYILLTILLPVICICLAYIIVPYFIYIGLFILIAMIPTTIWLISNQKIEFEYQVVDNFLVVDKIIAKKRRKKIVRIRIDEIKEIVKFSDNNYKGKKINKYFICVDDINADDVYGFTFYNEARGNCAIVMCPNETILMGMRTKLNPALQVQVLKQVRCK